MVYYTDGYIKIMVSNLEELDRVNVIARELAFEKLIFAQCDISGSKVGAAVVAKYQEGSIGIFGGCNLEFATSFVVHAERVALLSAVSQGAIDIISVHVTSSRPEQCAALCCYCRQDFMYVNQNTMIYVYNPDKSLKIKVRLIDAIEYPYLSGSKLHYPDRKDKKSSSGFAAMD